MSDNEKIAELLAAANTEIRGRMQTIMPFVRMERWGSKAEWATVPNFFKGLTTYAASDLALPLQRALTAQRALLPELVSHCWSSETVGHGFWSFREIKQPPVLIGAGVSPKPGDVADYLGFFFDELKSKKMSDYVPSQPPDSFTSFEIFALFSRYVNRRDDNLSWGQYNASRLVDAAYRTAFTEKGVAPANMEEFLGCFANYTGLEADGAKLETYLKGMGILPTRYSLYANRLDEQIALSFLQWIAQNGNMGHHNADGKMTKINWHDMQNNAFAESKRLGIPGHERLWDITWQVFQDDVRRVLGDTYMGIVLREHPNPTPLSKKPSGGGIRGTYVRPEELDLSDLALRKDVDDIIREASRETSGHKSTLDRAPGDPAPPLGVPTQGRDKPKAKAKRPRRARRKERPADRDR